MGTHISRVKSVDLDSWTDEQLQSVLKWGNSRANKYWEAKLAPGHAPSEAKIENFIRTKYESKRWVMDGPIPDPETLGDDDDTPLNLVKEKANIERSASQRVTPAQTPPGPSAARRAPQPDLFAGDPTPRANTVSPPTVSRAPLPQAEATAPKAKAADSSLLGLDFFGAPAPAPNRPASAAPATGGQSRPDLKQSILSLYASAPKPAPTQQPQHQSHGSFGGMQSPSTNQQTPFGGVTDAFSGLSFGSPASPPTQAVKPSPFAGLGNISSSRAAPQPVSQPNYGGGGFFDAKPAPKAAPAPPQTSRTFSSSSGFGAFDSAPGVSPAPLQTSKSSAVGDLFDFTTPAAAPPAPKQTISSPPPQSSVFNLSQPQQQIPKQPAQQAMSGWGNSDAWGSTDAWGGSDVGVKSPTAAAPPKQASSNDFGWASGSFANQSIVPGGSGGFATASAAPAKPVVAADDDFGGWSSAAPVTPAAGTTATNGKPAATFGGASEDLFSNVWE